MAASSTTVDLSRLPPPRILDQPGFEELLTALVADLKIRAPALTALVDSDPVMKLLQVAAYRELLLRQAFQEGGLQNFVAYATGANLDHLGALVGVTRLEIAPADPVTGAARVMEDDAALRQRIVLAPESFTVAGPELAYVARAKAADARVLDASATSPAPGEVLVTVLARNGDGTADTSLLAAVRAIVTDRAVRPLGDLVTVASAALVPCAVDAAVYTFAGPDPALIIASSRAGLDAYLADCRRLGRDVTVSGLHAALTVAGVQRLVLASPLADVVCSAAQVAHVTAIAVTHAGYDD
jgi:phage-related baseplate assembly protein